MPDNAPDVSARAAELRLAASRRWLVKDELAFLLHHWRVAGVPRLSAVRPRPASGSLVFFDAKEVPDYKKDGWRWQKRKDKSGRVREDRAKLVINRSVIVLGSYVHSEDVATFHRRSYYMRDAKDSIVLVHYFDEAFKDLSSAGRALPTVRPEYSIDHHPPDLKSLPAEHIDAGADVKIGSGNNPLASAETDACGTSTLAAVGNTNEYDLDMLLKEDEALAGIASDFTENMLCDDFSSPVPSMPKHSEKCVKISDFSPEWDYVEGGSKILICLAAPLPDVSFDDQKWKLYVQFGRSRTTAEKLSDTVIRCTAPSSNIAASVDIFIVQSQSHDEKSEDVLLSHKSRFEYRDRQEAATPMPPPPILASVSLNSGNTAKRGRSPGGFAAIAERRNSRSALSFANLSSYVESDLDERQCKIRVVERLSEFQQAIWTRASAIPSALSNTPEKATRSSDKMLLSTSSSASVQGEQSGSNGVPSDENTQSTKVAITPGSEVSLDDSTIETLSDHDLEQLSDQLLERVVRQLITLAHTSEELLEELNSLDETGLSLLHYVSFYNYAHLVPVLLAHGAHVNQQSTQGQTALHLAAGCGHDELVAVLLESGADVHMVDFAGLTAADRAEKSGHQQVGATLRRYMSSSNSTSSPARDTLQELQLTDCYPMEIDDDPVLYHEYQHAALWTSTESSLTSPSSTLASNSPALHSANRSHAGSFESGGESSNSSKGAVYYADENHEHNRKFLLGAFSTMSLHDKCALSLSISRDSNGNPRRRGSSITEDAVFPQVASVVGLSASPVINPLSSSQDMARDIPSLSEVESVYESDVKSVIAEDEESLHKLEAAIELMGPEERQSLEEEVRVLQHNVRAWLLRRNCRNMRETTKRLHEATKSMESQQPDIVAPTHAMGDVGEANSNSGSFERERAAVTVQAATRTMLARRNFLQTKHVAIKVQAATRGVLCRKHFARMKAQAQASLVIQRNVREWWNKQPGARPGTIHHTIESWQEGNSSAEDEEEDKTAATLSAALGGGR